MNGIKYYVTPNVSILFNVSHVGAIAGHKLLIWVLYLAIPVLVDNFVLVA
jgi:hypothetical protein